MKQKIIKIIKESYAGIFISLCLSFMLFFYEPLNLYSSNAGDFWFDIYHFFPIVLMQFLIIFLALSIFFIIMKSINKKLYIFFVVCFLVGTICSYVEGNFLAGSLPKIDGNWVDFDKFGKEKMFSLILWGGTFIIIALVLWKFKFKKLEKVSFYSSLIIIAMLSTSLITFFGRDGFFENKYSIVATYKNFGKMSSNQNLIVFVVDTVDSQVFKNQLEQYGGKEEIFEDFTYYPDTLSGYPFTRESVPLILSGDWYENDEPYSDYLTSVMDNSPFFEKLEDEDFKLNYYGYMLFEYKGDGYPRFDNLVRKTDINPLGLFKEEMKIIMYKYLPYQLKWRANIDSSNMTNSRNSSEPLFTYDDMDFVRHLEKIDFETTDQKTFKFLHIFGAHPAFVFDKDLNRITDGTGTYEKNVDASITIIDMYLKRLKENNVFDNSAIVILADHGQGDPYTGVGRQNPFLLVKGINEKHEYRTLDTRITYENINEAFIRLAEGKSSTEAFEGLDMRRAL